MPKRYREGEDKTGYDMQSEDKNQALYKFYLFHDILVRLDAIQLRKMHNAEFYPAVRTTGAFPTETNKKASVIQFLLNDIPQPDLNTPWKQILDFRSDEDIRNKYLALIKWINNVSTSDQSLNVIEEEYESLYSDYMRRFKIHKLKYNNSVLELLVTAGAGALVALQFGEFASSFKNLLSMKLSHVKLLEEEMNIPGREVAYIYHAKKKFASD